MEVSFNSYYLYKKYEKRVNQPWLPVYPETLSIDGNGSMPKVLKTSGDPVCYVEPQERWVDSGEYACEEITASCTCNDFTFSPTAFTVSSAATSVTFSYTGCTKPIFNRIMPRWCSIRSNIYDTGATTGSVIVNISANTSSARTTSLAPNVNDVICQELGINQESGIAPTACTCDAFSFSGTSEGNNTYRIEIPSSETAVTAATWNTDCGLVPQDFVHTDDSGFQVIVTDGHWAFDNNIIRFTASTNPTSSVREGYMTITYTVNGNSCTKVTHLVQAAYAPPFDGKFKLTLNDSSTVSAACDSTSAITSGDVSSQYSDSVVSAVIGDCVTTIGNYAFEYCSGLTSCTIGSGVTSIGQEAFGFCSSLTSVTIPDSVTNIGGWAFYICYSLTSCTIGSGVTSIGVQAFMQCFNLTGITIPDSVTNIGKEAFEYCSGLTSCTIGSGVTSIDGSAFLYCTSLTSIDIPDSVRSIGNYAFEYCSGLTSCTIGSGVTSIGKEAFSYCSSLTSVTVKATTPPTLGTSVFGNTNNCPIYVPTASVNTYKTATYWSVYADRIQPIP